MHWISFARYKSNILKNKYNVVQSKIINVVILKYSIFKLVRRPLKKSIALYRPGIEYHGK